MRNMFIFYGIRHKLGEGGVPNFGFRAQNCARGHRSLYCAPIGLNDLQRRQWARWEEEQRRCGENLELLQTTSAFFAEEFAAACFFLPIEVRILPGPQVRGTGSNRIAIWKGQRDRGHPPSE